jgi:ribosomal 30S subunit maturation factor RimM
MPEAPENWQQLIGSWVELRREGKVVRTGEVEDATPDSSVLWLKFDGINGRQLVARTDGYEVRQVRCRQDQRQ